MLVLAGAGSGKTRVITHRIVHLIHQGVAPQHILGITFTNKAAREMRERVAALLAQHPAAARAAADASPTLATFHALGVRILREHHNLIGVRKQFAIYDRADCTRAVKTALERAQYDKKEFEPRRILAAISHAKGQAQSQTAYAAAAEGFMEQVVAEVWQKYEEILRADHALDFDDLLLKTLEILRTHEAVRQRWQAQYRYLHVDEYQDTNKVQFAIADQLLGPAQNICAVGDIDQSIYTWRGADIKNILRFEQSFPQAKTILLAENYRSTQTIIAASNEVIAHNSARVEKEVFTNNAVGEPIAVYGALTEIEEAEYIALTAKQLLQQGVAASDIAVLFRTNFQSRVLEDTFLRFDIPYQMLGTKFFERKEVKDLLSFLRLALNPDSTADLARIINTPPRGIGKTTLLKLLEGRESEVTGAPARKVSAFFTLMEEIRAVLHTGPLSAALKRIIELSGLSAHFTKEGTEEDMARLENLRELVSLAQRYDDLSPVEAAEALLENAALQSDQDTLNDTGAGDAVRLMTVHAAKGLEYPYVFISGLEEGLFPHERLDEKGVDTEEERRLFYVALTRAMRKVYLTYAQLRTIFGSQRVNVPSSFLSEISDTHLEYTHAGGQSPHTEKVIEID